LLELGVPGDENLMAEDRTQDSIFSSDSEISGSNQQKLVHFFAKEIKCRFLMQTEQYNEALRAFDICVEKELEGLLQLEPFFKIRSKQIEAMILFKSRNFGNLSSFIDRELLYLSGLRYNKNELFFYIVLKIRLLMELEDFRTAHLLIVEQIPYALGLQLTQKYVELKILELQVLIKIGAHENAVQVCEDLKILINRANPNLKAEFFFSKSLLSIAYIGNYLAQPNTKCGEAVTMALSSIIISAKHCLFESVKALNFEYAKRALFLMGNVFDIQNSQTEKDNIRSKFIKVARVQEFIAKNLKKVEENGDCLRSIVSFQTYILKIMQSLLLA